MKFTYGQKLQMCQDHLKGLSYISISKKYHISKRKFEYIWLLYKNHGLKSLKHKYVHWTNTQKQQAIIRVLHGESIRSVSLEMGLSDSGTLSRWLKEYKENGYTIVERKRGRRPMNKSSPKRKISAQDERLKQLEKENLELIIENEYLKKLDALVQKRKAQQQGIKSK